jgi:branched-chain amino acid transport system ATP-binding protein
MQLRAERMDMLLEVKDLNTYYGTSHVLQGISLNVAQGEIVALLGRNGMGKSTTLKSIMGLVKPKSGSVIFNSRDITGCPPYKVARAGIGYVPEDRRIFPNLSVLDNLDIGVKGGKIADPNNPNVWTMDRIFHHFLMLKERAQQKGKFLSGGEQQMLTIGRSLMGNPDLLLVDEPTEGLAPLLVKEVRDILEEINKAGVSILLVEHNIKVAMSLAKRIYLMGKAHIGFAGTMEELRAHPDIREKYLEV